MNINPDMLVLAREYRNYTQEELARKLFVSQATIAKIEGGVTTDIQESLFDRLCSVLNLPVEFFSQNEDVIGFGSSAYFYRKKSKISAPERKQIHSWVNLLRIHLKKMLDVVEVQPKRVLPSADIEEYGGSATKAAQALRTSWSVPDGPIKNITQLIESAGVVVIPVDFNSRFMDGTCLRLNEMPPIIFVNSNQSGDRLRFTLAHELAHLILHAVAYENMEDEADEFASEFLMPEAELAPQFSRLGKIRLIDLSNLKSYWKCSMAALLMKAKQLEFLTDNQARYLWMQMSKQGWRTNEPNPIDKEVAKTYLNILNYFKNSLNFEKDDFSKLFKMPLNDLYVLYASIFPRRRRPALRAVV